MSPALTLPAARAICFPRVSGDEPFSTSADGEGSAFSPRERG